jgi:hypothetical protein
VRLARTQCRTMGSGDNHRDRALNRFAIFAEITGENRRGTNASCHKRTNCERFPLRKHPRCQLRGSGQRCFSIQLLLAAVAFFVCGGCSRNVSFLCEGAAIPSGSLGAIYRLRFLSRLARQTVPMQAESSKYNFVVVLNLRRDCFHSVSTGDCKLHSEWVGQVR